MAALRTGVKNLEERNRELEARLELAYGPMSILDFLSEFLCL
jgi:hypothetical protein